MRERPSGGVLLPGAALLGGYAATAEISVSERMAIAGRHKFGFYAGTPEISITIPFAGSSHLLGGIGSAKPV